MAKISRGRRLLIVACLSRQTLALSVCCVNRSHNALVVASLAERVAQPLETLVETVTGGSASRLDVLKRC